MAEENQTPDTAGQGAAQADQPRFSVMKLFIKDVSFESPSSPEIFQNPGEPELKLNLNQRVKSLEDNNYEVILTVTVTCKVGEQTAYLAEVQQGGLFNIVGFEPEQAQATLGSYCPAILFPYARQQISDLVLHGGFQPLLLQPVNFDQLYAEQIRRQQAEATAS